MEDGSKRERGLLGSVQHNTKKVKKKRQERRRFQCEAASSTEISLRHGRELANLFFTTFEKNVPDPGPLPPVTDLKNPKPQIPRR